MSILRLSGVTREVGTLRILDSVDASVPAGARIGLVGPNGAGKTTLLRLAAGLEQPDAGRVERKRGLELALLAQEAGLEPVFAAVADVRTYVRSGARRLEAMEAEMRALESVGGDAVQGAAYAELQERFEASGGYDLDRRVDEGLSGLGIPRAAWSRPPTSLSGGQQTLAALARIVIADPELLLLDEPTNHLDVTALEWLESALLRRSGALIIASHDRALLDVVPDRTWELRDHRLTAFRGGYSAYALQREERDARARREAAGRAGEIAREERLIATYRRQRKHTKMHEHEARLARLEPVAGPRDGRRLSLPAAPVAGAPVRSGDTALSLRAAIFGLAGRRLLFVPRLQIRRGERIGIVGPNGSGKTTLLRTLAGDLPLVDGQLRLDHLAEVGYLAQLRSLNLVGETVLDAVLGRAPVAPGEARAHLARFQFRGDDVFKSIAVLSGGERSRLELALLGLLPSNLLLLDEPTNHLDIGAREALELFLRETAASVVLVSHDRRLLDAVCQRLLVIRPGPAPVDAEAVGVVFEGSYGAWRAALAAGWNAAAELARYTAGGPLVAPSAADGAPASPPYLAAGAPAAPPSRRPTPTGTRLSKDAYRRRRSAVEADLTRLGLRRSQIELALAEPSVQANFIELRRLTSELTDVGAALGTAEDAWLALEERAPR